MTPVVPAPPPAAPPPAAADLRRAERVREAVLAAVASGFEEAGLSGLCREGALDCALGRARALDLAALLPDAAPVAPPLPTPDP